ARSKEIGERRLDVAQALHMGDKAPSFDREDKALGRRLSPSGKKIGPLQRIERAVDLDRIDMPAGISELVPLPQPLWIKDPAPTRVIPAGQTDADLSSLCRHPGKTPVCPGCRCNAM